MSAGLVNTDNQLICTNSEYSQVHLHVKEQVIPLAFSAVYLSPQTVEADVAKFNLVSLMSVMHCCLRKVILGSPIHSYSDSSLWPRAGPGINLAQIS